GACRGSLNTSALKQLDEELELNKRRIEIISLNGFSPSEVQKFLEQTLGGRCSDDLVDVCYKLTRGNASHLQLLVESLKGSALIRLQDGEWTCDRHVVDGRYAGQNTELMLMETMNRLSSDAREVLSIIACMGRFNKRTILDWLDGDVALMESILKEAINTGLLTIGENEGHFTDMQTGEMLYLSLEPDERT